MNETTKELEYIAWRAAARVWIEHNKTMLPPAYYRVVPIEHLMNLLNDADRLAELERGKPEPCAKCGKPRNMALNGYEMSLCYNCYHAPGDRIAELEAEVNRLEEKCTNLTNVGEYHYAKSRHYLRACKRIHKQWKGGSDILKMCQWFLKIAEDALGEIRDEVEILPHKGGVHGVTPTVVIHDIVESWWGKRFPG
jgi:hypothetical protein